LQAQVAPADLAQGLVGRFLRVYALYASNARELNAKGGAAATSGGLIVGSKGMLQIETMLNQRLFNQVQQLGKKISEKPLLYAVNTSSHGDHSYGNMYLPSQTRIVPGHGVVMTREDIKWHIDYLNTIKQQVQAAIKQGLTREQTVKQVSMEAFRGYQLFDWVHPGLNVPAAYKDLSKK
jgi:glyoxylase-like metal-dependent hydrolase (beta-lactamase superfamily II)